MSDIPLLVPRHPGALPALRGVTPMRIQPLFALLCSTACLIPAGCGDGAAGQGQAGKRPNWAERRWKGVVSAKDLVVEWVHDGTGWLLGKDQVDIELDGEVLPYGDGHVACYKIRVSDGDNTFETRTEWADCDPNGVPTEESIDEFRAAIEDIKSKIRRLQD